jgi:hypothetical protein
MRVRVSKAGEAKVATKDSKEEDMRSTMRAYSDVFPSIVASMWDAERFWLGGRR